MHCPRFGTSQIQPCASEISQGASHCPLATRLAPEVNPLEIRLPCVRHRLQIHIAFDVCTSRTEATHPGQTSGGKTQTLRIPRSAGHCSSFSLSPSSSSSASSSSTTAPFFSLYSFSALSYSAFFSTACFSKGAFSVASKFFHLSLPSFATAGPAPVPVSFASAARFSPSQSQKAV